MLAAKVVKAGCPTLQTSHPMHWAVAGHHVAQVRDCSVPKSKRSPWRRMLGHHATLRAPRDPAACIFQVCPQPCASNASLLRLSCLVPLLALCEWSRPHIRL